MLDLKPVQALLGAQITDNPKTTQTQLTEALRLSYELLQARTQAYNKYLTEHERLRHPKDKDYTDFDRKSMVDAAVADRQEEYEYLHGLERLLNTRIEILKDLLNATR